MLSTRAFLFGSEAVAPDTATLWLPKPRRPAATPAAAEPGQSHSIGGRPGLSSFSPSAASTPQRHFESDQAFQLRATAGQRKHAQMVAAAATAAAAAAAANPANPAVATPAIATGTAGYEHVPSGCLMLASGLSFRTTEEGLRRHFGCREARLATWANGFSRGFALLRFSDPGHCAGSSRGMPAAGLPLDGAVPKLQVALDDPAAEEVESALAAAERRGGAGRRRRSSKADMQSSGGSGGGGGGGGASGCGLVSGVSSCCSRGVMESATATTAQIKKDSAGPTQIGKLVLMALDLLGVHEVEPQALAVVLEQLQAFTRHALRVAASRTDAPAVGPARGKGGKRSPHVTGGAAPFKMAELLAALRFDAVSVGLIENAWTALPPLPPKGAAAILAAEVGEARVAGAIAAEVAPREVALVAHLERLCAAHALSSSRSTRTPHLSAPWRWGWWWGWRWGRWRWGWWWRWGWSSFDAPKPHTGPSLSSP